MAQSFIVYLAKQLKTIAISDNSYLCNPSLSTHLPFHAIYPINRFYMTDKVVLDKLQSIVHIHTILYTIYIFSWMFFSIFCEVHAIDLSTL